VSTFQYFDIAAIETAGTTEPKRSSSRCRSAPTESVQQEIQNRRLIVLFYESDFNAADALLRAVKSGEQFYARKCRP